MIFLIRARVGTPLINRRYEVVIGETTRALSESNLGKKEARIARLPKIAKPVKTGDAKSWV
jgi:hypothetical protein